MQVLLIDAVNLPILGTVDTSTSSKNRLAIRAVIAAGKGTVPVFAVSV